MKLTTIQSTKDYSKFTVDESNRNVKKSSLKKLSASMAKYGWLPAFPMLVVVRNGKHVIIDGQHRYTVAEKLGLPVVYVVHSDDVDFSIPEINNPATPWKGADYIDSFCNQGNPHYIHLRDFAKRHKLAPGISSAILSGKTTRASLTDEIRDGSFKVNPSSNADLIGSIIARIKNAGGWVTNHQFVNALQKCVAIEGFNPDQFVQRCKINASELRPCANTERYLEMIEAIYNKRTRDKDQLPIRFLAMKKGAK